MFLENNKKVLKILLKVIVGILIYLFFLVYTPTIYGVTKDLLNTLYENKRVIVVGNSSIKIKELKTAEERIKGLSGTDFLEQNNGMFFHFDTDDYHGIWMKDMNYSIDIIWFDKYGEIVHIEENVSPITYPKVFKPEKKSRYVLELNAGTVSKEFLKLGDTIDLY